VGEARRLNAYVKGIWDARYFWTHLALADLRSRWRRSYLGILWTMIQPLGITLLLAFVLSRLFKTDIAEYAVYILSGIIVWDFIAFCSTSGALSYVQADAYIKQYRHPLAIYPLRTVLSAILVLLLASVPLFVWALVVLPQHFGAPWLATLSIYPILGLLAWPLATLLAYLGARFRDLPHALTLVLQALWFVSPVYFEAKMFRNGGLDALVDYNPVYHVLQLLRAPLLEGKWPTASNYLFSVVLILTLFFFAWLVGRVAERKVIFYL
jgi:lipopolysaccharide transport system permease protein